MVAVEHEKPIDTFQDMLDNDMYMMLPRGTEKLFLRIKT